MAADRRQRRSHPPSAQRAHPGWLLPLLVGFPLLLRLLCLLELQGSPVFRLPLVDALVNHRMAAELASGTFRFTEPFWQPPFYGYFLGLLYKIGGPSPVLAKIVQALLGSLSCWLLFRLSHRLLGRRAAWLAWGTAALYGPFLYFDLQLLNAGLVVFLLLLALERLTALPQEPAVTPKRRTVPSGRGDTGRLALGGLALGLSCITVATCVVALAVVAIWLWRQRSHLSRQAMAAFAAAAVLPIAVVAVSNISVSGEPILISYNGGINYWLGNNPEYEKTVAIRPGRAWEALLDETKAAGAIQAGATSSYWFAKAGKWRREHPGDWLLLQLRKARLYFRGDEIGRNQQLYPLREHSVVLRLLLWSNGLAFPFGLVLPWAAAGIGFYALGRWRDRPRGLGLAAVLLGLYSAAVIAFFMAARYRLPMAPLFILFAAGGAACAWETLTRKEYRALILPGIFFLVFAVLANAGLPPAPKQFDSDTHSDLGVSYQEQNRFEEARARFERALELNPDNMEAANNLGVRFLAEGRLAEAEALFRRVLSAYPEDKAAILNLGAIFYQRQEPYPAGHCAQVVLDLDPAFPNAAAYLRSAEQMAAQLEAQRMELDPNVFLGQLEQLFLQNPANAFLFRRLLPLLDRRNDTARALRVVEARLAVAPGDPALLQLKARYQAGGL